MKNKEYISYLNTLHNYNAQNTNSYGEKNVKNNFYKETMVDVLLGGYIVNSINTSEPHVIILTGHAGDGKTSIMYQVIEQLGQEFDVNKQVKDYQFDNGKKCRCIKDFSEFSDKDKLRELQEVMNKPNMGEFAFMVANTGPLINTFGRMFEKKEKSEEAKIQLIEAMDSNLGQIQNIMGYKICVINVAAVDNTYFAGEFIDKITQEKLWDKCEECTKKEYCHIYNNYKLIDKNSEQVKRFLNMHYTWMSEYGKRMTIRSMTGQLVYMITAGENCEDVKEGKKYNKKFQMLFSNSFFGYYGVKKNLKANNVVAIRESQKFDYYNKRFRVDEDLLIHRNYEGSFSKEVATMLKKEENMLKDITGWNEAVRRTYMFLNTVSDEKKRKRDYEDIFSKQYQRYLQLTRNDDEIVNRADRLLIIDALSMIYIGVSNINDSPLPLTLSRENGITQNVQLLEGKISTDKIQLKQKKTSDCAFGGKKKELVLKIDDHELKTKINLPLLNYFNELKNGIISTNIDPQLSHGIESLKAELSECVKKEENDELEIIILKTKGPKSIKLELSKDGKIQSL